MKNKEDEREKTSIFITEGDSASGTITKVRNANTQAVFSLRGKPINCFKESRKKVAENEELNLLVSALGVEEDLDDLRYNNIIVATDADDDGMHIRMCYSIDEKEKAVKDLKTGVEITRFKGLGEISSHEFVEFIGEKMRLDPVKLADEESISEIMEFYMGDNTAERQRFIMENLRSEEELEDVNI